MQGLWHRHARLLRGVVALIGALAVAGLASLGVWQLERAAARGALQQRMQAAAREPAVAIEGVAADAAALAGHHVVARGQWIPEAVIYLDNRPHAGAVGVYVLMALRLDDGRVLVIDRGWLARDARLRTRLAPYRTPEREVELSGIALADESRLFALGGAGVEDRGGVWQNFDRAAFERVSGLAVLPLVVRAETPADDGLVRDWPDQGAPLQELIDRNHGYAVQWFAMAATLAALLIFYGIRNARNRKP